MIDWDKRYREGFYNGATDPHPLLVKHWRHIPGPRVLDVPMGSGRDAIFLAGKGYFAAGLEKSGEAIKIAQLSALDRNVSVRSVQGDVSHIPFKAGSFDGITVFYFLDRAAMGEIAALLRKGGVIIYETYLKKQNEFDGPRNPDYLLDDGELRRLLDGFDLIFYEEAVEKDDKGKKKAIAKAVGKKK